MSLFNNSHVSQKLLFPQSLRTILATFSSFFLIFKALQSWPADVKRYFVIQK